MRSIAIRPKALADLAEIWAYIAQDSPKHADLVANRVDRLFRTLAKQPGMGHARPELLPNLRSIPIGNYVIFYIPRDRGIDVARVLHGSRDLDSMFDSEDL
jgi:toxin ParE1/3/4